MQSGISAKLVISRAAGGTLTLDSDDLADIKSWDWGPILICSGLKYTCYWGRTLSHRQTYDKCKKIFENYTALKGEVDHLSGNGFKSPKQNCIGYWEDWGACKSGKQSRTYVVTRKASGSGTDCAHSDGDGQEQYCAIDNARDCSGSWSDVGFECVDGYKKKQFTVLVKKEGKGQDCAYDDGDILEDPCGTACQGEWVKSPCKDGTQVKTYQITTLASDGGADCEYEDGASDDTTCGTPCVGDWGDVGECENGKQTLTYTILQEAKDGGRDCSSSKYKAGDTKVRDCYVTPKDEDVWIFSNEDNSEFTISGNNVEGFVNPNADPIKVAHGSGTGPETGNAYFYQTPDPATKVDCVGRWTDFGPCEKEEYLPDLATGSVTASPLYGSSSGGVSYSKTRYFDVKKDAENGGEECSYAHLFENKRRCTQLEAKKVQDEEKNSSRLVREVTLAMGITLNAPNVNDLKNDESFTTAFCNGIMKSFSTVSFAEMKAQRVKCEVVGAVEKRKRGLKESFSKFFSTSTRFLSASFERRLQIDYKLSTEADFVADNLRGEINLLAGRESDNEAFREKVKENLNTAFTEAQVPSSNSSGNNDLNSPTFKISTIVSSPIIANDSTVNAISGVEVKNNMPKPISSVSSQDALNLIKKSEKATSENTEEGEYLLLLFLFIPTAMLLFVLRNGRNWSIFSKDDKEKSNEEEKSPTSSRKTKTMAFEEKSANSPNNNNIVTPSKILVSSEPAYNDMHILKSHYGNSVVLGPKMKKSMEDLQMSAIKKQKSAGELMTSRTFNGQVADFNKRYSNGSNANQSPARKVSQVCPVAENVNDGEQSSQNHSITNSTDVPSSGTNSVSKV